MNFSKSHFINELKKTNDALHESISNSLDSTILNEAKSEDWDDVDTLQDFSVLISKIVKAVLPNLVKLKPKTKKEFEKLLAAFKNGLDDISESNVSEATDSLGHPSRIKLRDPETAKLNRINALYDAYMNLAKHMESSGAPQDKIDLMKLKASDLMTHLKDM